MKALRLILAALLLFSVTVPLTACGVKGDLDRPDAQPMKKGEKDPSKPPAPLGK